MACNCQKNNKAPQPVQVKLPDGKVKSYATSYEADAAARRLNGVVLK